MFHLHCHLLKELHLSRFGLFTIFFLLHPFGMPTFFHDLMPSIIPKFRMIWQMRNQILKRKKQKLVYSVKNRYSGLFKCVKYLTHVKIMCKTFLFFFLKKRTLPQYRKFANQNQSFLYGRVFQTVKCTYLA